MRQKAVSIAPQKEAPIQSEPMKAAIPIVVELSWIRLRTSVSVCCSTLGKRRSRSLRTLVSTPLDLQHLAEDEEDQQGEGEDRQHQVVGDHRREAGDVLAVRALPKGAQPGAGMA